MTFEEPEDQPDDPSQDDNDADAWPQREEPDEEPS